MFSINNVLNRRSFLVGATLIFAPIYYTPASVLLKNAKDMSYDMTLMGVDGMDSLCDPGRQVHRRLSAYTSRPAGRFIQGKDACNRTETLLSHNKVAKLHKPTVIRRIMDKWAKQKKS